MITLNIGSAIGETDKALSIAAVVNELTAFGLAPTAFRTGLSGTETTYIIRCPYPTGFTRAHVDAMVHDLSAYLLQDAIAYTVQHGALVYESLVGPKAADWGGEFDPAEFLPW